MLIDAFEYQLIGFLPNSDISVVNSQCDSFENIRQIKVDGSGTRKLIVDLLDHMH